MKDDDDLIDLLVQKLRWLKLPGMAKLAPSLLERAATDNLSTLDVVHRLAALPRGARERTDATAKLCGEIPHVLYVRYTEPGLGVASNVELAPLGAEGLGPPRVLGRASAISAVSLALARTGALVVYVAAGRTWAAIVPCDAAPR